MVLRTWKVPVVLFHLALFMTACQSSEARTPGEVSSAEQMDDASSNLPPRVDVGEALVPAAATTGDSAPHTGRGEVAPQSQGSGVRTGPIPSELPRTDPNPPPLVEEIRRADDPDQAKVRKNRVGGIEPAPTETAPEFEKGKASDGPEKADAVPGAAAWDRFQGPPLLDEQESLTIPAGAEIHMVLEATVSTKTHLPGDLFFSRVTEDVLAEDGLVLVPMGTRARGRVLESRKADSERQEPSLRLEVLQLLFPGRDLDLCAEVLEADVVSESADSDGASAAKVATGAAAGALLGRILGKSGKSAVKGAIAGAIAGGAVAYATRDGHAEIREGASIAIQLLETVVIPPQK